MNYTLSDFLNSQMAPGIRLLTSALDFSGIPVKSASVQEITLDNFVQPDEIILSTGIGMETNPELLLQFIREAGQSRAAAVIFSFRNERFSLPDMVKSYADSISLPIFLIPWRYRFSVIQASLLDAIREKELSVFKEIQNTLFNLFFDGEPLDRAAGQISRAFGCASEITDLSGTVLGTGIPPSPEGMTEDDFSSSSCKTADILINGAAVGKLLLYMKEEQETSYETRELLEKYAAFPLSLWFNRQRIEELTAARLKNDFVRNLAAGNYSSFDEMMRQGTYLGFDLSKPYTCILMQAEFPASLHVREYSALAVQNTSKIEKIFLQTGHDQNRSVMAASLNMKFLLFLEHAAVSPEKGIGLFIDSAESRICEAFPSLRLWWGISESPNGPCDFSRLHKNAALALQYCLNDKNAGSRFTYKDTKKSLIVSALAENPKIRESARETLAKLLEYDASSDVGLLKTLTEFIRTNYNTSQTARNLHIHGQSLLYRLEKIETLTNLSLDRHDDLFILEVFTRIFSSY